MPVWPGDEPFHYHLSSAIAKGSIANVGSLQLSTHSGTHVDAPFHFEQSGKTITEVDLNIYIGPARVIDMTGKEIITVEEIDMLQLEGVKRILFKTMGWKNPAEFPQCFPYIEPDAVPLLASRGVCLVGVDVPSVDPYESEELPAHHSLNQHGIYILESLLLDSVEPGDYELIALPLPLENGDGSPVRAILRR